MRFDAHWLAARKLLIFHKSRRRSIAAGADRQSASEDPGRGNVRKSSMPPRVIKNIIGAAAPEVQTKGPASAHDIATGVEETMDAVDETKLTRTRGDFGVSGLTPGRDPALRQRAEKDQTLQPELAAAPVPTVLPQLGAVGTATGAATNKASAWGGKARTPDQKEPMPGEASGTAQHTAQEGGAPPQAPLGNEPTPAEAAQAAAALRKTAVRRLSAELGTKEPVHSQKRYQTICIYM